MARIPDIPAPVEGPSIIIDGKQFSWEGNSHSKSDETAEVARVVFECISGQRKTEVFQVKNNGSTAIYFNWNVSNFVNCKGEKYLCLFFVIIENGEAKSL